MAAVTYTEREVTEGLMAMVAWAGNSENASKYLAEEKGLEVDPETLIRWKRVHADEFDAIRDKNISRIEASMAHEMRDVARLAVEGERLAIRKTLERLEANKDEDPSRTAANLARVKQSAIDKTMTLEGRPTQITESRKLPELLRSLVAMGVISLPAELTEGGAEPDEQ